MKACPTCAATYPLDFTHCPKDGSPLAPSNSWVNGNVIRDKYRIVGIIGTGGMATVYKAEHIHFREQKALKVIHSELAADTSFVKRFIQEAVLTRRLQHPHAVRVDDIERAEDGRPFMVMEFIDGVPLAEEMRRGPLPLAKAAAIAKQTAEALGAAHALGMVHRDIKPGNIVLQKKDGAVHVKVLDFGIAKVRASYSADEPGTLTKLTFAGAVIGTPLYMSPEQAAGKTEAGVDGRSDLYSLGVLLYQMLAGRAPLTADSDVELLAAQIRTQPTPLGEVRPDLPGPVCALTMACLAKEREGRPQDCGQFIRRLDAALSGAEPLTVLEPAPSVIAQSTLGNRGKWLIAAAVLSFAMVGFALMRHSAQVPKPAPPVHLTAPAPAQHGDVNTDSLTVLPDRKATTAPAPVKRKKKPRTPRRPPEVDLQ